MRSRGTTTVFVAGLLLVGACSGSGGGSAADTTAATPDSTTTTVPAPPSLPALATDAALAAGLATAPAPGCDPLDAHACMLPFPSDALTTPDPSTDTGVRVSFVGDAMPANVGGVHIDPAEWNRNDGFSPNSSILTVVDGLDAAASKLPSWTDPTVSLSPDSPVVMVDIATAERVPLWAEPDDETPGLLVIHPAVSLAEGHRFAVALRSLVGAGGAPIEPSPVFRAYRDRVQGPDWLEARRDSMEEMFAALTAAGVDRSGLTLAWNFTVSSSKSIVERMLGIRDAALKKIGTTAPAFTVDSIVPSDGTGVIDRKISGTFEVPNFLAGDGSPGNGFWYGADGLTSPDEIPQQNGTLRAGFTCNIPKSAVDGTATGKTHLVLYGHGLLGSNDEIDAGNVQAMANEYDVVFCATKWAGMSEDDIPNAISALQDVSKFSTVTDRLQQGVLNAIVLGRLMTSPTGLTKDLSFAGVTPDLDHLDYDGNSQGGIMGLMLTAVSPDIGRAVLGVPGMNYSLLLPRSVDFDDYESVFKPAYPDNMQRMLILSIMQMLWDRGEGGGYVQHVTSDPYPATPAKQVLLDVALGDHQVTPLSALIEARALGAEYHEPIDPARTKLNPAAFGLTPIASYPYSGSGIIIWDSGAPDTPLAQIAPRDGHDPHEDPRADPDVRRQKAAFLFDRQLVDVCNGAACTADARD